MIYTKRITNNNNNVIEVHHSKKKKAKLSKSKLTYQK